MTALQIVSIIRKVIHDSNEEEPTEREEVVRKALSEIARVQDDYGSLYKRMGNRKSLGQLANSANGWKNKIEFGATLNKYVYSN